MTDSFDIQYGGWGEKKWEGKEGKEQSEEAEQACGVFNHSFASATACMSAMFVAYLIIHPRATDPLN